MKKLLLIVSAMLLVLRLSALECVECGKRIKGEYLKNQRGDTFCSRDCAESRMPRCYRCKKACAQSISFRNRTFCSRKCLHAVFKCSICRKGLDSAVEIKDIHGRIMLLCPACKARPCCYFCSLPTGKRALRDGRTICRRCYSSAVTNEIEVRRIFDQVRRDLSKMFDYDEKHHIELHVVDAAVLNRKAQEIYSPENGRRMALMNYRRTVQTKKYPDGTEERNIISEKCEIYVLDTMPRDRLYDAFAHELTHDYLRHNLKFKPRELDREEGFCELVAALYNIKRGKSELNLEKEKNPDPVYGGGYRKMRSYYRVNKSFKATLKHVR